METNLYEALEKKPLAYVLAVAATDFGGEPDPMEWWFQANDKEPVTIPAPVALKEAA